jgi:hypothetical protein
MVIIQAGTGWSMPVEKVDETLNAESEEN